MGFNCSICILFLSFMSRAKGCILINLGGNLQLLLVWRKYTRVAGACLWEYVGGLVWLGLLLSCLCYSQSLDLRFPTPFWNSNTLATWCEELTHWKRPWCWERLKAEGEGDDRGWDGWMASLTQWIWVWASSGNWWRTGKPGMLQSMGSQRVGQIWLSDWTELNPFLHEKAV